MAASRRGLQVSGTIASATRRITTARNLIALALPLVVYRTWSETISYRSYIPVRVTVCFSGLGLL